MEVRFNVSLKTVKRCIAMLEIDIPSDEEIRNKFSNVVIDLSDSKDEDIKQAELGFTMMAIGQAFGE